MQEHTWAFQNIKDVLTKEQELMHFDPNKDTVIQTDVWQQPPLPHAGSAQGSRNAHFVKEAEGNPAE